MSNERIDLTKELEWLQKPREVRNVGTISQHDVVVETDYIEGLIAELKRCYDLLNKIAEQAIPDNEDPELYGYVIDYEVIKSITKASE